MTKKILMLCGALLGASAFKDVWTKLHKPKTAAEAVGGSRAVGQGEVKRPEPSSPKG